MRKHPNKARVFSHVVRVERIELSSSAWKADILPLNYTRIIEASRRFMLHYSSKQRALSQL